MGVLSGASARAHAYFGWISPLILRIFPGMSAQLRSSGRRLYAEAYAALVGSAFVFSAIGAISASYFLLAFLQLGILSLAPLAAPFIVLLILGVYPWFLAKSSASAIEAETPHAAAYISVMATGGVSPYTSFNRLRRVRLLPAFSQLADELENLVRVKGMDPVSAMEEVSKTTPSEELRELFRGYVSAYRMGGDTTHYLLRQAEVIFERRESLTRTVVEKMAMLAEAYLAISILLSLGLFMMFLVGRALPIPVQMMGLDTFLTITYIILPFLSTVFVYLADVIQPRHPSPDNRPYYVLALAFPFAILALMVFFASSFLSFLSGIFGPFLELRRALVTALGLSPGFQEAFGLIIPLLILLIPPAIVDTYSIMRERRIFSGVIRFLREVVEVRKTGLAPERSIESLASTDYGGFTKILRVIANRLSWGAPYREIFRYIESRIRSWRTKISLFIFFDAIEVGGGTPETLETLARFNENIKNIEYIRASSLRPLVIIPYVGAFVLIFTTLVLLGFMRSSLLLAGHTLAFDEFLRLFLPPLVLNVAIMGIVAGKISEERASAGFKHAVLLLVVSMIAFVASPTLMSLFIPPTPT